MGEISSVFLYSNTKKWDLIHFIIQVNYKISIIVIKNHLTFNNAYIMADHLWSFCLRLLKNKMYK